MSNKTFKGVGVSAIAAALPQCIVVNREYTEVWSAEDTSAIVEKLVSRKVDLLIQRLV